MKWCTLSILKTMWWSRTLAGLGISQTWVLNASLSLFSFVMVRKTFCTTTLPSHTTRPHFSPLLGIYAPEIVLQVCRTMVIKKNVPFKTEIVKNWKIPKVFSYHTKKSFLENVGVYTLEHVVSTGKYHFVKIPPTPRAGPTLLVVVLGKQELGTFTFCYGFLLRLKFEVILCL